MIKNIVHLSDIHIRNATRHVEYVAMFSKVADMLASYDPKDTVIVVTGDIAHSKNTISPEFVGLASQFFNILCTDFHTFIFPGNHDGNLKNTTRLDALSPIVDAVKPSSNGRLHFSKFSETFEFENLAFHHFSVFDNEWGSITRSDEKTNVGIYHGMVNGTRLETDLVMSSNMDISTFKEMDMTLLGDIHVRQDFGPNIAYAGSLIQQNFGESLLDHGYLVWDVTACTYTAHNLPNDWCFYTIDIVDNKPSVSFSEFRGLFNQDAHVRLRLRAWNSSTRELYRLQEKYGSLPFVDSVVTAEHVSDEVEIEDVDVSFLHKLTDVTYQNTLIKEYLGDSVNKAQLEALYKLNTDMNARTSAAYLGKGVVWKPTRFEWSNTFSYQGSNVLNFNEFSEVVGIIGSNHSGKSSIFDSLIYCIFGKCPRTSKASAILNNQSDHFEMSLDFNIGGTVYNIHRWSHYPCKTCPLKEEVTFHKIEDGAKYDLTGDDRRKTDQIIRNVIGSYEDFLLTTYSAQNSYSAFVEATDRNRSDIFSRFLGVDVFDALVATAKEYRKELKIKLEAFPDNMESSSKKLLTYQSKLGPLQTAYDERKVLESKLDTDILKTVSEIGRLQSHITTVDVDALHPIEELKSELVDCMQAHTTFKADVKSLEASLANLDEKLLSDHEIEEFTDCIRLCEKYDRALVKHQNSRKKLITKIKHQTDIIESIGEYRLTCDICKSNELAERVRVAIADRDTLNVKLTELNQTVDAAASSFNESTNLAGIASDMLEINKQHLKDRSLLRDKISKAKDSLIKLHGKRASIESDISTWALWLRDKDAQQEIRTLQDTHSSQQRELAELRKKIHKIESTIRQYSESIKSTQSQLTKFRELKEQVNLVKTYLQMYGKRGLPVLIVQKMIPKVRTFVNEMLHGLENFSIEFGDGTDILIVRDGMKWDLEMCSGMEKFLASLALRVALHKCAILPKANFLLIDEGFGNLDAENIVKLESVFETMKKFFKFIMVISHVDTVKDYVSSQIVVDSTTGKSILI